MEDYAVYLASEAESDIAALHQFMILYDNRQEAYHFFFEGEEDRLYYMPEARRRLGQRVFHAYDCGGKKNVIEVRNMIALEGYDSKFCLFFVDRDYDDLLGTQVVLDRNTYITDYYSIENDVSTTHAIRIILDDVIQISRADPEFDRIIEEAATAFEIFYLEIRPLMAWILAAKETGCAPNLGNTCGLKNIVQLSGMDPTLPSVGFAEFKRKVVTNGQLPKFLDVLRWRRRLSIESAKFWVRGKYDVWFFQNILLIALQETSNRRMASGGRAIRVPASLREGRIFELLGGRVAIPISLQSFLDRKLQ